MVSSGVTAVATTDDTAVDVITEANTRNQSVSNVRIVNEGTVAGFYSIDGGINWIRISAAAAATSPAVDVKRDIDGIIGVKVKRVASGSNLSAVYAEIW